MKNEVFEKNAILKLSFDFSLMIIDYCEKLEGLRKFVLANQLLKSGTSIGANFMEAQNAESKALFIRSTWQQKKLRKPNIGLCCVIAHQPIKTAKR